MIQKAVFKNINICIFFNLQAILYNAQDVNGSTVPTTFSFRRTQLLTLSKKNSMIFSRI